MLYSHHGESTASDDKHHLPPHQVDQREREDEQEERDRLFEVDPKDDRKGCLNTRKSA